MFTLVDADRQFIDVDGAEGLRTELERILSAEHLSPQQIIGVWESNAPARNIIEAQLGPDALRLVEEHLPSLGTAEEGRADAAAAPSEDTIAVRESSEPEPTSADQALALQIDPTWGIQKIFQHYRAALSALAASPARGHSQIATFPPSQYRCGTTPSRQALRAHETDRCDLSIARARDLDMSGPVMLPRRRKHPKLGVRVPPQRVWPRHRRWVKSHGCCVPNCNAAIVDFAHLRSASNAGKGLKPHDAFAVSLCRTHHIEQHSLGEVTFERRYGIDLQALAAEFVQRSPDLAMRASIVV
jgi:hypothetical protein